MFNIDSSNIKIENNLNKTNNVENMRNQDNEVENNMTNQTNKTNQNNIHNEILNSPENAELQSKKVLNLQESSAEEKESVLEQLQKDLQLQFLPRHIECFDNSNLHGTNAVAAIV